MLADSLVAEGGPRLGLMSERDRPSANASNTVSRCAALSASLALTLLLLTGCGPASSGHRDEAGHGDHGEDHADHEQLNESHVGDQDEHDEHDEHGDHSDGVVRLTEEAIARIGLETDVVERRVLRDRLVATGTVGFDEERLAHVGARTPGRLVDIPARLGATVSDGEVIAVVDSTELGHAKAEFLRAGARLEVAQSHAERERALHADQITSEAALIEAEAEAREAAADHAVAHETLLLLGLPKAEIDRLRWSDPEASRTAIRAPFAGKVVERDATLGELVETTDSLFLLADIRQVWLWIDLYERDISKARIGQKVEVRMDAWPEDVFTGRVSYLGDQLDSDSRTLRARVDLPNPGARLRPGMFGRAFLEADDWGEAEALTAVLREALLREGNRTFVFIVTEPGTFERRWVETGTVTERWAEVVAGLSPGDEVVVEGAFLLKSQSLADELGGHHH